MSEKSDNPPLQEVPPVTHMADASDSSVHENLIDLVERLQEELAVGDLDPNTSAFLIMVDHGPDGHGWNIRMRSCRLVYSKVLAMLETAKTMALHRMGYNVFPEDL